MVAERQDSGEPATELSAMAAYVQYRLLEPRRVRDDQRRRLDQEHQAALATWSAEDRQAGERVLRHGAAHYGIAVAALIGPRRTPELTEARAATVALLTELGWGPTKVGRLLRRDHATVLHHLHKWPAYGAAAQEALADIRRAVLAAGAQTPEDRAEDIKRAKRLVGMVAAEFHVAVPALLFDPHGTTPQRLATVLLHCVGLSETSAAEVLQCPSSALLARWVGLGLVGAGTTGHGRQPLTGDERRLLVACAGRARQRGLLSEEAAARVAGAGMPQGGRG